MFVNLWAQSYPVLASYYAAEVLAVFTVTDWFQLLPNFISMLSTGSSATVAGIKKLTSMKSLITILESLLQVLMAFPQKEQLLLKDNILVSTWQEGKKVKQ